MTESNEVPAALAGCLEACRRCAHAAVAAGSIAFATSDSGAATMGAHLRHCVEHFQCFFDGLPERAVDYDARARDTRLETEQAYFLEALEAVTQQLDALAPDELAQTIKVAQIASGAGEVVEAESTVERELVFLSGHTIHHLALIDYMLRAEGIAIGDDAGLAFSTAAYHRASS